MTTANTFEGRIGPPWNRGRWWSHHAAAALVLGLLACLYFTWTWGKELGLLGSDGPSYLMMANHYAHAAKPDPVYSEVATYSRFPPLYPLVLSWCSAADDIRWAHTVTTGCLFLALIAYYIWLLLEGMPPSQSTLLMLLFATMPGSWLAGLTVQSEYLYVLWSVLAIALMTAYRQSRNANLLFGIAMAIALATLTRTIGIALFVPFFLLLSRAPRRQAALALIISVLPLVLWYLLHRSRVSYTDALTLLYSGDALSTLRSQLSRELPALRMGFDNNFLLDSRLRPCADLLGVLCLAATFWRAFLSKTDAIYILANLAVLLVWPYPEEAQRFLWVLLPLMLVQPLQIVAGWTLWPRLPSLFATTMAGMVLLMTLPALAIASDRYRSAPFTELPEARHLVAWYAPDEKRAWSVVEIQTSMINAMKQISEMVPLDDCVISTRPDLINYFARRRSYFAPLNSTPDPYFAQQLSASGCHYVFGIASKDERYPVLMFPLARLGGKYKTVFYDMIPMEQAGKAELTSMLVKFD